MKKSINESLGEFLNIQSSRVSEITVKQYEYTLKKLLEWIEVNKIDLESITDSHIGKYSMFLMSVCKLSPSTIDNKIIIIRKFIEFYTGKKFFCKPVRCLPHNFNNFKRTDRRFSPKQLINKIEDIIRTCNNLNHTALICVLWSTGARTSELRYLDIDDIEISNKNTMITIKSSKNKDGSFGTRKVLVYPGYVKYIEDYIKSREDSNRALFISNRGERISVRTIQEILQKYGLKTQEIIRLHRLLSIKFEPHIIGYTMSHRPSSLLDFSDEVNSLLDEIGIS